MGSWVLFITHFLLITLHYHLLFFQDPPSSIPFYPHNRSVRWGWEIIFPKPCEISPMTDLKFQPRTFRLSTWGPILSLVHRLTSTVHCHKHATHSRCCGMFWASFPFSLCFQEHPSPTHPKMSPSTSATHPFLTFHIGMGRPALVCALKVSWKCFTVLLRHS